jgi:serine/threonine-protein kinase HipA
MAQPIGDDLQRLRQVDQADVYKGGRHSATLTRTADGVEFRYLGAWIVATGAPVATTLPVQRTPVLRAGGALPSYVGLLPEGRRLGALQRAVKTSADDELSLLLAVGADAIGDVQVVPVGVTPVEVPPRIAIESISQTSFTELLSELGITAQRSALPGVQDKTSAAMINLPIARAGERFILKLNPIDAYPHLVENEAFFLDAARMSGLTVPPSELVADRDGKPALLIRRFDRITVDGELWALAAEDGCQAADRPPADKYRIGVDHTFSALAAACDAPALAGRELIRQLVFSYLIGNGDAHAKNFSIVQDITGEWRVSPLYDVPCSYVYGDTTMAMSIAGRTGQDFNARDFLALGTRLGVPERAVTHVLDDLAARVDRWMPDLDHLPFDRAQIAKLRRVVGTRRRRIASR